MLTGTMISGLGRTVCVFVLVWMSLFVRVAAADSDLRADTIARKKTTYSYGMSGRVRFLLFWLGRDNVGRGKISFEKNVSPETSRSEEKISVLFGTLPERVPWRINRWGFGEEVGYWNPESKSADAGPEYSVFIGFIRHSPEESISQISSSRSQEQKNSQFWYDGITSAVRAEAARTDIYYFPLIEEVTAERMEDAVRAFEMRRKSGASDKSHTLSNHPRQYDSPVGFLLCLRRMLSEISQDFRMLAPGSRSKLPRLKRSTYVYNAKPYALQVERLKLHANFRLDTSTAKKPPKPSAGTFTNVAEAVFQIHDLGNGDRHSFQCWFPVEGPLESIPIQIQDNPRWWLQVRLQLLEVDEH